MSDELAQALANVLNAVEAYDKEQPVQTRLATKHTAMRVAMSTARVTLATHKARRLDGEPSPEYVTADWPKESVML